MTGSLREPDWLTADEEKNPPHSKTRTPLYQAHPVDDVFFFGFDLTIDEAKGTARSRLVLRVAGASRRSALWIGAFATSAIETFDDVCWNDAVPGINPGQFLAAGALSSVSLTEPSSVTDPPKHDQWNDDRKVNPAGISAARWAYMLLRQPVMVAVHADELLQPRGS